MNTQLALNVLIGLAVIGLVLFRQLQVRPVSPAGGGRMTLIIGVVGLVQAGQYVQAHGRISGFEIGATVLSLAVGFALAILRGHSVRLWHDEQGWWRQGTAVTLALWLVAIVSHLGLDLAGSLLSGSGFAVNGGLGGATMALYLAIVLGVQNVVVGRRAAEAGADVRPVSPARF